MALVNSLLRVRNKGFESVVLLNETTLQKPNQTSPITQNGNGIESKRI